MTPGDGGDPVAQEPADAESPELPPPSEGDAAQPLDELDPEVTAEDPLPVANQRDAGRRAWGLGSLILSGGIQGARLPDDEVVLLPAVQLPSFEMAFFLRNRHAVEVSVPIVNILLTPILGAIIDLPLFVWRTDVFYNFNVGRSRSRLVIGSGLGVIAGGAAGVVQLGLRVPVELGIEVLSSSKGVSFRMLLRPYFEVYTLTGADADASTMGTGYGGGALLGFGVMGYKVRH